MKIAFQYTKTSARRLAKALRSTFFLQICCQTFPILVIFASTSASIVGRTVGFKTPIILVDDDPIFGELWTSSCPKSINLRWISDPNELFSQSFLDNLEPSTTFYVDQELGNGQRG